MDYQLSYQHPKYPEKHVNIVWERGFRNIALHYLGEEIILGFGKSELMKGIEFRHHTLGTVFFRFSPNPLDFELCIDGFHCVNNRRHPARRFKTLRYLLILPFIVYFFSVVELLTSHHVASSSDTITWWYFASVLLLIVAAFLGMSYGVVWPYFIVFGIFVLQGALLTLIFIGEVAGGYNDWQVNLVLGVLLLAYFGYAIGLMSRGVVVGLSLLKHRKHEIRNEALID